MTTASSAMRNANPSIKKLSWFASDREEWVGDIPFTADTAATLPTQGGILPSDRYIFGLRLELKFRSTQPASGGPTIVNADAPWSLIERIDIQGYHRPRAAQEDFFNVRASDAWRFFGLLSGRRPTFQNSVNGGAPQTTISVTASATNDIIAFIDIWFPPPWAGQSPDINRAQMPWLLDAPNYDRLIMTLFWGDVLSLYGAGTSPTLSAYGSGTGSPTCRVQGIFAMAGKNNLFSGFVPGRVWRYFVENTTGDIVNTVSQSRQYNIPRGYRIGRIYVKAGVKSAVVTASNNAYVTLSDTILANMKINFGTNKIIKFYQDFFALKESVANDYTGMGQGGAYLPEPGVGIVDWLKHGHLGEAVDAQALVAGPTGDVDVYLSADTVAGANQGALYLVEELRGKPTWVSGTTTATNTTSPVS